MKLKNIIAGVLLLAACKKADVFTYKAKDAVYFNVYNNGYRSDSSYLNFLNIPAETDSYVFRIPVMITGVPAAVDRSFIVVADTSSTAVAGKHYRALPPAFTMHAGKSRDTIAVVLLRTPDMKKAAVTLRLQLQENENFKSDFQPILDAANKRTYLSRYTIRSGDMLVRPPGWWDFMLGDFTLKKLFLICRLMDKKPDMFEGPMNMGLNIEIGIFMQHYLDDMRKDGAPVLEDNGDEMTMGPGMM
ncbi:DUF4843 domain-containing protein [Chitinophaga sp. Mgbs1]|uniref:DUF4843 domain-containing protein n=1 Tax=Chitinophaga solisilvae TaxID=1233460 RepID=A0A9Q5DCE1_9BACT|nr:DUF4843 domain-containing protein [Chitinophaga solisilvae]